MTLDDVPLTRLAGTAQERIAPDPAPVADALAKYAETDLLCYRAEHPLPLVVRQAREWQPWLDWLEQTHGARLLPHRGDRPPAAGPAGARGGPPCAGRAAAARSWPRSASPIPALGSAALGLALAEGALDAQRAHELASLDELYQVEQWGEDEWAQRRRTRCGRRTWRSPPGSSSCRAPDDRQAAAHRGPGAGGWLPRLDGARGGAGSASRAGCATAATARSRRSCTATWPPWRSCCAPAGAGRCWPSVELIHEDLAEPEAEPGFRALPTVP